LKYTQIFSNTSKCTINALKYIKLYLKYNEVCYEYSQMHWKNIQILWCLYLPLKYLPNILQYLHYIPLEYVTMPLIYSNMLPYTFIFSCNLSIPQLFVLSLYCFSKLSWCLIFLQKCPYTCHDIFAKIKQIMHIPWIPQILMVI
jgi:hypothetical protein